MGKNGWEVDSADLRHVFNSTVILFALHVLLLFWVSEANRDSPIHAKDFTAS